MKKIIIILVLGVFCISSCLNNKSKYLTNYETYNYYNDSINFEFEKTLPDTILKDSLKKYFFIYKDDFSADGRIQYSLKQNWLIGFYFNIYKDKYNNSLMLSINYRENDWIFMQRCIFLIDTSIYDFTLKDVNEKVVNNYNHVSVTETSTIGMYKRNYNFLLNILRCKDIKYKIIGKNTSQEKYINDKNLLALKRCLLLYKVLNGSLI